MDDPAQAAQTIAKFLQAFTTTSGLRLRFRVKARSLKPRNADSAETSGEATPPPDGVAKDGPRALYVEFTGPDTPVLTARNGELLNALEHIANQDPAARTQRSKTASRSTPTSSRPTATARCTSPRQRPSSAYKPPESPTPFPR